MVKVTRVDWWTLELEDWDDQGRERLGRKRVWHLEDWQGVPGQVFRKHHMEVDQQDSRRVTWWKER